jgi:hypothetical protein
MQELIAIINRQAKTFAKEVAAVEIANCPVDEILDDEADGMLARRELSAVRSERENCHESNDRLSEATAEPVEWAEGNGLLRRR